jgi:hypothetical protein
VFIRDIDFALQRAEAAYAPEIWQTMSANQRSAAIYPRASGFGCAIGQRWKLCSITAVPAPHRSATHTALPITLTPLTT